MSRKRILLVGVLVACFTCAFSTWAPGAQAASKGTPKSYGCQMNPKASACTTAPKPVVKAGTIVHVKTGGGGTFQQASVRPASLPRTGGGIPQGSNNGIPMLVGIAALLLGLGFRRVSYLRS